MSTLQASLDRLDRWSTGKSTLAALAAVVAIQVFFAVSLVPSIKERRPDAVADGALIMVDLEPFIAPARARTVFALYTDDIRGSVRMLYAFDFALPVASALFFTFLFGLLRRLISGGGPRWRVLLLLPWVSVPFDFLENVLALVVVGQPSGEASDGMIRAIGLATAGKFFGLTLTILTLVALLGLALVTFVRRRRA